MYIDNFLVFGGFAADANWASSGFAAACDRRDWGVHAKHSAAPVLAALGIVVDGTRTVLYHQLPRLWRFVLATQALLRRHRWRGEILDVWLGHAICISALARCLISVLQEVYIFALLIRHSSGMPLHKIRMELLVIADLGFLAQANMAAPLAEEVYVGDASTHGWALMSTSASFVESSAACRFYELWRF